MLVYAMLSSSAQHVQSTIQMFIGQPGYNQQRNMGGNWHHSSKVCMDHIIALQLKLF